VTRGGRAHREEGGVGPPEAGGVGGMRPQCRICGKRDGAARFMSSRPRRRRARRAARQNENPARIFPKGGGVSGTLVDECALIIRAPLTQRERAQSFPWVA